MPDRVMVTRAKLDSLAEAVGSKSGQGVPLTIEGMEDAVLGIETGIQPSGTLAISKNGTHDVTKYASAMVSVNPKLQEKTVHPTTEIQDVVADRGYDGLDAVVVEGMDLLERSVTPSKSTQVIYPIEYNYVLCSRRSDQHSASTIGSTAYLQIPESVLSKVLNSKVTLSFSIVGYGPSSGKSDSVEGSFVLSHGYHVSYANDGHYLSSLSVYNESNLWYLSFRTYWNGIDYYEYSITVDRPHDALSTVTVEPIPPEYIIPNLQSRSVTPTNETQVVTAGANDLVASLSPGTEGQAPFKGLVRFSIDLSRLVSGHSYEVTGEITISRSNGDSSTVTFDHSHFTPNLRSNKVPYTTTGTLQVNDCSFDMGQSYLRLYASDSFTYEATIGSLSVVEAINATPVDNWSWNDVNLPYSVTVDIDAVDGEEYLIAGAVGYNTSNNGKQEYYTVYERFTWSDVNQLCSNRITLTASKMTVSYYSYGDLYLSKVITYDALSQVTVEPIPSNYGLITWDGSVLTVS